MCQQEQVGKARLIGYAVGIALAVIAVVWKLVRQGAARLEFSTDLVLPLRPHRC
jgi:hypothetical protein